MNELLSDLELEVLELYLSGKVISIYRKHA